MFFKVPEFSIKVRVLEHSVGTADMPDLITYEITYPRYFHAELMTHRMLSRNASSSRAIPVKTFLKQVWNNPAVFLHWGANNPGMQSRSELKGFKLYLAKQIWVGMSKLACIAAWSLNKLGAHKQWANRLLEPWQFIKVVVTATDWANFFTLRDHPDAMPEFRALASAMKTAASSRLPVERARFDRLDQRAWHLPYVTLVERQKLPLETLKKISAARCARTSYNNHDGTESTVEKDVELYDRLVGSKPEHASPVEHQALCTGVGGVYFYNFNGWMNHRYERDHAKR